MADLKFNEIIEKLQNIHEEFPDMRFGAVLQAAIDMKRVKKNTDLHDVSSKKILNNLTEYEDNLISKKGGK